MRIRQTMQLWIAGTLGLVACGPEHPAKQQPQQEATDHLRSQRKQQPHLVYQRPAERAAGAKFSHLVKTMRVVFASPEQLRGAQEAGALAPHLEAGADVSRARLESGKVGDEETDFNLCKLFELYAKGDVQSIAMRLETEAAAAADPRPRAMAMAAPGDAERVAMPTDDEHGVIPRTLREAIDGSESFFNAKLTEEDYVNGVDIEAVRNKDGTVEMRVRS